MSDRLLQRVQRLLGVCFRHQRHGFYGLAIANGKARLVDRWGDHLNDVSLAETEAMRARTRGQKLEDALRVIRDQQTHIRLLEEQLRPGLVRELGAAPGQEQLEATS